MTKSILTLATVALLGSSGGAIAAPLSIDLGDGGVTFDDGFFLLDLLGFSRDSTPIITGPDGIADVTLDVDDASAAISSGVLIFEEDGGDAPDYTLEFGFAVEPGDGFSRSLQPLGAGDTIDGSRSFAPFATFYDETTGALSLEGSVAFFGFSVTIFERGFIDCEEDRNCGPQTASFADEPGSPQLFGGPVATYFGYFEATRGSITIDQLTVEDQADTAITIPDTLPAVPLPAAGWMLLAGIGGLAAAGRRRKG